MDTRLALFAFEFAQRRDALEALYLVSAACAVVHRIQIIPSAAAQFARDISCAPKSGHSENSALVIQAAPLTAAWIGIDQHH